VDDFDGLWKIGRCWIARECTDGSAGSRQLKHDLAADGAGGADDQDRLHGYD